MIKGHDQGIAHCWRLAANTLCQNLCLSRPDFQTELRERGCVLHCRSGIVEMRFLPGSHGHSGLVQGSQQLLPVLRRILPLQFARRHRHPFWQTISSRSGPQHRLRFATEASASRDSTNDALASTLVVHGSRLCVPPTVAPSSTRSSPHQPIEQLASLRALPGLCLIRPADANETAQALRIAVDSDGPTGLVLTRQEIPVLEGTAELAPDGVWRGAYVLVEEDGGDMPDVVLVGTGSEVQLCVQAALTLKAAGIAARVVSFPSWDLFEAQEDEYRETVIPFGVPAIAIEAASPFGWERYVDDVIGISHFGASAPGSVVLEQFGITADALVERATALLDEDVEDALLAGDVDDALVDDDVDDESEIRGTDDGQLLRPVVVAMSATPYRRTGRRP